MTIHTSLTLHQNVFHGGVSVWTFRDHCGAYVAFCSTEPETAAIGEDETDAIDALAALIDHMSDERAAEEAQREPSNRQAAAWDHARGLRAGG